MAVLPEKMDADLFDEIKRNKTPQCLSLDALGRYIEQVLPVQERETADKHVQSCLYCLNQLVELRDLLFLEKNAEPLPAHLETSLRRLAAKEDTGAGMTFPEKAKGFVSSVKNPLSGLWNFVYAWQSTTALALVAILVIYIGLFRQSPKESSVKAPVRPTEPNVVAPLSSPPKETPQANAPLIPKNLLLPLAKFRTGTDVPRIASTLQKLGKNLILENTRGERDIAVFQKASSAVVFVLAGKDSVGSGVLISSDGRVLTNWHVVGNDPRPIVVLKPKDSAELKKELAFSTIVEKLDQVADLALLRMVNPPLSLSYVTLGDRSALNVGQDVHAIGHPQGEVWTYTRGIISQIRASYEWKTDQGIAHRANIIQTQTPINPGNSGGPLLDDSARLIGINSFRHRSGEGLNYAVSVDTINEFLSRPGSREVARSQPSRSREMRCTEGYDTVRRGWNDIVGCYQDSSAPPPDVWVIYRAPNNMAYVAMDSDTSGKSAKIDLVRKGVDPQWNATELFVDSDCDGTIDLIMSFIGGGPEAVSSRLPPPNLRMTALARELDGAIKTRRVPYPRLRVCQ